MKRWLEERRGQIWVETVVYTLIGITIIGLVLAAIKPKIDEKKDEIAIGQAIEALNDIDSKIYAVQVATGNKRAIELKVGKGEMILNVEEDYISWEMESSFEYSQEGIDVSLGKMNVTTTSLGSDLWKVRLFLDYSTIDLKYENNNQPPEHKFGSVAVPYKIIVENRGPNNNQETIIDITDV